MSDVSQFQPSHYQQAIFDWIVSGRGDAVVQAVAGAGKTTVLVESAKLLRSSPSRASFLSFNKHVAEELQKRLGNAMVCKTIHSVGMGCLRSRLDKVTVASHKYADLAKPYADEIYADLFRKYQTSLRNWRRSRDEDAPEPEEPPSAGFILGQLKKLAHFCMATLTPAQDRAAVSAMVDHFDCLDDCFDLKDFYYPLISLLKEGERLAEKGIIDYDDMLWLPHCWQLEPPKQDWVFIDESQDLNPAQLDLVLKMRGKGGRLLFVGEPKQAIYGFAGASSDSVEQIIEHTQATTLPLSISYRCPTSHIKLAQEIVPQIEPAPGADEGIVETVSRSKVHELIREGDLVISRCTAPAVRLCIELIAKRIPARVRGRDIGKALTNIVREVGKRFDFEFKRFAEFLEEYKQVKIAKLKQRRNSESQIESLNDRIEGIQVCYEAFDCESLEQFCSEIEELFSDIRSSVVLSTIHRAKGLEEGRVFILRPDQLPLRWANQRPWQLEQEMNLKYVALTRSKQALYFVE